MRKKSSTEEYLTIADLHIEAAEQRIRQQKRRLFEMAGRGEDVRQKMQFLALLHQALRTMRSYRSGVAQGRAESAGAGIPHPTDEVPNEIDRASANSRRV